MLTCALAAFVSTLAGPGHGAASNVTVTFTVQSSTTMTPTCATAGPATSFGSVPAGTPMVTGSDCSIQFGSSNDTAALRLHQRDLAGSALYSQPFGDLDPLFGTAGSLTWDVPGGGDRDEIDDVVPLDDGTGRYYVAGSQSTTEGFIARFHPNGTLDTTFSAGDGSDGYLVYTDGTAPSNFSRLALHADGRIVLATWVSNAESPTLFRRYLATGAIDPSFDDDGSIVIDTCDPNANNNPAWQHRMLVDSQDRILVAGSCSYDPGVESGWTVTRLLEDGSLDPNFATGGFWQWNYSTAWEPMGSVTIDTQGRVVVTGETRAGGQISATWVRLLDDGTPDPTFDGDAANRLAGNGFVAYREGGYGRATTNSVVIDDQGRILSAMSADNWSDPSMDSAAMRLNADGSRDTTFGTNGFSAFPLLAGTKDEAIALVLRPGSILVSGASGANGGRDAYVAMLREDGSLDQSFDGDGVRTYESQVAGDNRGLGLTELLDGQVLLWGTSNITGTDYMTSAHLLDATPVDDYDDAGGDDWSGGSTTSMFGVCLRRLAGSASAATITEDAGNDCGATDTDSWAPIAAGAGPGATIATVGTGIETGVVDLRFGVRTSGSSPTGRYLAPIVFEVVAPAA